MHRIASLAVQPRGRFKKMLRCDDVGDFDRAGGLQIADGHGNYLRTFNIDPAGKLLIAAPLWAMPMRDGSTVSAGLVLYRVGSDGKLTFTRKYDIDASEKKQQFWAGLVSLV